MTRSFLVLGAIATMACGAISDPGSYDPLGASGDNGACQFHVTRHQPDSWLLTNPEVHMDFWGDWSHNQVSPDSYLLEWYYLLNEDGVLYRLNEYGIHAGSFDIQQYNGNPNPIVADDGGAISDAGIAELDDTKFATQLQNEIRLGSLPYPNDNTIYVVMLPQEMSSHTIFKNGWGGYHGFSSYAGQRFTYAIIGYGGTNGTNITISHEIYEAATDPGGDGFWDSASSEEIADICEGSVTNDNIDGYTVQKVWSQVICQCE